MDVSVVICTRNGGDRLSETLNSFRSIWLPKDLSIELLLIDNASTDHTSQLIEEFEYPTVHVRRLSEPNPGKSRALNAGVQSSEGTVLLFTDDDVRFPNDWIDSMAGPILAGETEAIAGGVRLAPELDRPWMTKRHRTLIGDTQEISLDAGNLFFGANMAVSRKAFDRIFGYLEQLGPGGSGYGAAEDAFIALQLQRSGFRILGRPNVQIEHHPSDEVLLRSAFRRKAIQRGRSEAYLSYHWEHRTWPMSRLLAGWTVFYLKEIMARRITKANIQGEEGITLLEYEAIRRRSRIAEHIRLKGKPFDFDDNGIYQGELAD